MPRLTSVSATPSPVYPDSRDRPLTGGKGVLAEVTQHVVSHLPDQRDRKSLASALAAPKTTLEGRLAASRLMAMASSVETSQQALTLLDRNAPSHAESGTSNSIAHLPDGARAQALEVLARRLAELPDTVWMPVASALVEAITALPEALRAGPRSQLPSRINARTMAMQQQMAHMQQARRQMSALVDAAVAIRDRLPGLFRTT